MRTLIITSLWVLALASQAFGEIDLRFLAAHTTHVKHPVIDEVKITCDGLKDVTDADHAKVYKLNPLNQSLGYDDVWKLTIWNLKRTFKERDVKKQLHFPEDNWRKLILDDIFEMFRIGCPNRYVPHQFLNVIYEMAMIYYNTVTPKKKDDGIRWNVTSEVLEDCKLKTVPLALGDVAMKVNTLNIGGEEVYLMPPHEVADGIPDIDLIVDAIWWIFSFSFGSCYFPAGYRSTWAPKYKQLFVEDFMEPLELRWLNAGPHANFGVIFGNFDISHIFQNMRLCVTAAYTKFGIADRQLVRPLMVGPSTMNFKSGSAMDEMDYDNYL